MAYKFEYCCNIEITVLHMVRNFKKFHVICM